MFIEQVYGLLQFAKQLLENEDSVTLIYDMDEEVKSFV